VDQRQVLLPYIACKEDLDAKNRLSGRFGRPFLWPYNKKWVSLREKGAPCCHRRVRRTQKAAYATIPQKPRFDHTLTQTYFLDSRHGCVYGLASFCRRRLLDCGLPVVPGLKPQLATDGSKAANFDHSHGAGFLTAHIFGYWGLAACMRFEYCSVMLLDF
jgi:hypothetical protein